MKKKLRKKQIKKGLRKRKGVAYFSYNLGKFALDSVLFLIMYVLAGLALFLPILLLFFR